MLSQIELDYWDSGTATGDAISAISYDARGRRTSVQCGNGTVSEYSYDPLSHRLERLESTKSGGGTASILQDNTYTYDAVGNITTIVVASQEACYFSNQGTDGTRTYTYDPLYRLIQADGREHVSLVASPGYQTPGWGSYSAQSIPNTTSPAFRFYEEEYTYDAVGNLTSIDHDAGTPNSWTRTFSIDGGSNRTASTTVASVTETFLYDSHGNLSEMDHMQTDGADLGMRYNHRDRMDRTRHGTGAGAYFIYYQYDSQGRRVRKIRETSGGSVYSTRSYFGEWELFDDGTDTEDTLHVSDGEARFLIVEQSPAGQPGGSFTRTWRYQLTDHLGSATVELDESENVLTREEYYPYGTSSFYGEGSGSFSTKRYRFTGQEKDEESGLQYHHHRYYAPWLGRWTRPDPAGMVDGPSRMRYSSRPTVDIDTGGLNPRLSRDEFQAAQETERWSELEAIGRVEPAVRQELQQVLDDDKLFSEDPRRAAAQNYVEDVNPQMEFDERLQESAVLARVLSARFFAQTVDSVEVAVEYEAGGGRAFGTYERGSTPLSGRAVISASLYAPYSSEGFIRPRLNYVGGGR